MLQDFLEPLIAVGAAELGDKTQLAILLASSRFREKYRFLGGVMLGFLLVDGLAILLGSWVGGLIPQAFLKVVSGLLFITFGLLILRSGHDVASGHSATGRGPMLSGFIMISIMEFGDKTQMAAGLFATRYDPLSVLMGTLCALFILSLSAVYLGDRLAKHIDKKAMAKIAAAAFILIGLAFILY
jgi:Ca2+/H+ antiporter, TMEM165/GDT1 family